MNHGLCGQERARMCWTNIKDNWAKRDLSLLRLEGGGGNVTTGTRVCFVASSGGGGRLGEFWSLELAGI